MPRIERVLHAVLFAAAVALIADSTAAADGADWCDQQWNQHFAADADAPDVDYRSLLAKWSGYEARCRGTGIYEARLATILLKLDEPRKAKTVLNGVSEKRSPFELLLVATKLHADFGILVQKGNPTTAELAVFEAGYESLTRKGPHWVPGLELASNFMLAVDKPVKAIGYAKRAVAADAKSWAGYRALTIGFFKTGKYLESIDAGGKAHTLRSQAADPEFMFALASSFAATKDYESTNAVLGLLVHRRPDVRGTAEYRETLEFARRQMPEHFE